jgi:cation:H+ antiporter
MLLENIAMFIVACLILFVSGTFLVRSLHKISNFLRISEFTAAFIIMAFATSVPELFVGISSAIAGNPALSLGNVIGSNLLNLTIITGIICLMGKGIKFKTKKVNYDIYYMFALVLAPIILFIVGNSLSRIDGAILIALFGFNIYRLLKKRKKYRKVLKVPVYRWAVLLNFSIFIIALVGLFFSAQYAVKYATLLSVELALPPIMLGLFLISFGTTLPELTFGIRAASLGYGEMAIGDQIGTIITNSSLILGIVALIRPITANFAVFLISAMFMIFAAFLLITFIKTNKRIEATEAIALILIYVIFLVIQIYIQGIVLPLPAA